MNKPWKYVKVQKNKYYMIPQYKIARTDKIHAQKQKINKFKVTGNLKNQKHENGKLLQNMFVVINIEIYSGWW